MKLILIALSVLFAYTAEARGLNCKTEIAIYKIPGKGIIDVCTDKKNEISFRAMAFGNGQQCGMSGRATLKGNTYIFKSRNCKVLFSLRDQILNAEFGDCWKGFCGMKANWHSGDYSK